MDFPMTDDNMFLIADKAVQDAKRDSNSFLGKMAMNIAISDMALKYGGEVTHLSGSIPSQTVVFSTDYIPSDNDIKKR